MNLTNLLTTYRRTKPLSVFHTNICSLQANFDNLQNLINNLDHQFSVVALSETWTPQNKNSLFKPQKLDGYQPYYGIQGNSLKSGCGFYVKDGINYKPRKDLDIAYNDEYNEFQCCWIEIINQNNPNILVGTYYRHPKKNSNNVFLEKLKENLHKLGNNNKITIVARDFNFDLLKYDYNNLTNDFLSIMYSNFFQPCILEPTRITSNNRPSLLDNIFINTHDKEVYSGNIIDKISDHMPNFAIINNIFHKKRNQKIMVRDMSHFNEIIYKKDLEELKRLDILKHKTVNEMLNTFHEKLLEIIDKNAPFRTLSKREKKLREKPWITKGILQSIRIKNNLYNRYIRKQDQFWYHRYKIYRSKVNMLISKSKKRYLRSYFQENSKNSKETWTKINQLLQKNTNVKNDTLLSEKGLIISHQKTVANKFNDYFINVAQDLLKDLGESNNEFQDYLKNSNKHSFFLTEVDPEEVHKLLLKINTNQVTYFEFPQNS